jgi:hypothetical protein
VRAGAVLLTGFPGFIGRRDSVGPMVVLFRAREDDPAHALRH